MTPLSLTPPHPPPTPAAPASHPAALTHSRASWCAPLQVFFRAGKLAFLDELTGSEYKELAPDIANKVRIWLIKNRRGHVAVTTQHPTSLTAHTPAMHRCGSG